MTVTLDTLVQRDPFAGLRNGFASARGRLHDLREAINSRAIEAYVRMDNSDNYAARAAAWAVSHPGVTLSVAYSAFIAADAAGLDDALRKAYHGLQDLFGGNNGGAYASGLLSPQCTGTPENPPTEIPPTEVPPTCEPTEVSPTEVPPTEVPPTEIPPTQPPCETKTPPPPTPPCETETPHPTRTPHEVTETPRPTETETTTPVPTREKTPQPEVGGGAGSDLVSVDQAVQEANVVSAEQALYAASALRYGLPGVVAVGVTSIIGAAANYRANGRQGIQIAYGDETKIVSAKDVLRGLGDYLSVAEGLELAAVQAFRGRGAFRDAVQDHYARHAEQLYAAVPARA